MQAAIPLACFLSVIRPPGVQYESSLLQIAPVDKSKCPYMKNGNDVGFQLFTRHNPTVYQELMVDDDEKLFASNIDFHDRTVLFFHAFMEQPEDGSGVMVREAYMQRGDTNVIMVDAHHLEAGPWYLTAAQNTWFIGRFAAQFMDYLVTRGLNLNNTHLVGHSLGAHSAGVAGTALKSGRVARITGLDPALPLFSHLSLEQRLDPSDAHFVDVIHTDAGIFGYKQPLGHADFFPNGGKSPQPGCELEVVIPQHLLLNKCDKHTKTRGFYTYYLQAPDANVDDRDKMEAPQYFDELIDTVKVNNGFIRVKKELERTRNELETLDNDDTNKDNSRSITKRVISNKNKNIVTNKETISFGPEDIVQNENRSVLQNETSNKKELTDSRHKEKYYPSKVIEYLKRSNLLNVVIMNFKLPTIRNIEQATDQKSILKEFKIDDDLEESILMDPINIPYKDIDDIKPQIKHDRNTEEQKPAPKNIKVLNIISEKGHRIHKRQKRFIQFFRRDNDDDNFLFNILDFLLKYRKNVLPVFTVMREINTLVKNGNGELNHVSKERNNYIGGTAPLLAPINYSLELGSESKAVGFLRKLFGLAPKGGSLTVNSS